MSVTDAAFPLNSSNANNPGAYEPQMGLSKREYFAGLVLQGLMAADGRNGESWETGRAAVRAVQEADALLAELAK